MIAAIALQAVVVVTGARAQTAPPSFAEPAEKAPRTAPPADKPPGAGDEKAPARAPDESPPATPPAEGAPAPSSPGAAQPPPQTQSPQQPPPAGTPPYPPPPYAPSPYPYSPAYPPPYPGYPPPRYTYTPQPGWPPPPQAQAYPPPPPGAGQVPTLTGYGTLPVEPAPRPPVVDPQGDRVLLLPTATTHPKGTFYFSNYELIIFQIGYAFTDDTQVSVTAIPVPSESVTALDFSLKSSIYRGGLVRAAAIGSASGIVGKEIGLAFIGRAGGVVQVCLARLCESSLSLSANAVMIGALLMVNGAGGIWRVSSHVSLLAELATMLPVGTQGGQFNGALVSGGVRLHYNHWGFDFAALHALDSSEDVATLPFFAMTWRP